MNPEALRLGVDDLQQTQHATHEIAEEVLSLPVIQAGQEQITAVREILASSLGRVIDPELATAIELAATRSTPLRTKVDRLTAIMETMPQADVEFRHHFAPGVFIREAVILKGIVATGAEHKVENLIIISKGHLLVATADGFVEARAGDVVRCLPGTTNAVHAREDSQWSNVWANPDDERDLNALIPRYFDAEADELAGGKNNRQLLMSGKASKELI
ncbi:MAG: hypothetical protein Q7U48_13975 [Hydrogenophaga sp.]|nr:hypothetical protein [Hydrogenophaga sp.]